MALLILFSLIVLAVSVQADDEFLVSFWIGPEATPDRIKEVAEANFTVAMLDCGSPEANKKALDLCRDNGIKAMLIDSRVRSADPGADDFASKLDGVVADYAVHPALWGYFIEDEPHSSQFQRLAAINKYLLKKDPAHTPFINLFPNYVYPATMGNPTYEHHVDEYMRMVKPKLLSYDHYALMKDGERPEYFDNFEIIRRKSIKYNTPWNYILLAVPHDPYRDPTESDLRWQVYTALAYGARGLMYFTYITPLGTQWNFHDAILDENGKRTPKYEWAKQLNSEIKHLAPTLMKLKSVAVYHTGTLPTGAKPLPKDGLISQIEGGEFVVGQFNGPDGSRYAMITNRDMRKSARAKITFSQKVRAYETCADTGGEHFLVLQSDNGNSVWINNFAPGDGKLIRIETINSHPVLHWEDLPTFRPRVMLNPSNQYANVIKGESGEQLYNEGLNMFDIALRVRDILQKDGRIDVFISRNERDEPSSLRTETALTRDLNCDILVSLHSDATGKEDDPGGGTWTFYADDDDGKRLAECVQTPLLESIRTFHPEVQFRGVRTHWVRLWVLHESGCPASLTEVLFHSHPEEREMLKKPEYQNTMATAIAKGILDYFGLK